jgi:hypothetical protein
LSRLAEPKQSASGDAAAPLFPNNELETLRSRWKEVQTAFVDEPRKAVEEADGLVASAMKRLAEVFAEERSKLEPQWDRGDGASHRIAAISHVLSAVVIGLKKTKRKAVDSRVCAGPGHGATRILPDPAPQKISCADAE